MEFISNVTDRLKLDLKRIHDLGVKKVAVASLQPLGCLPTVTVSNDYKKCNETIDTLVHVHNNLLATAVADLNNQTNSNSTFVILDIHGAFMSVLTNGTGTWTDSTPSSRTRFSFLNVTDFGFTSGFPQLKDPMKPCCAGVSSQYNCGDVDKNGTRLYTICKRPRDHFFWDSVHPTQAGWSAVFTTLLPSFRKLLYL